MSDSVSPLTEKIRVHLFQKVGGWRVSCDGHADEHVCLAASTLFNAVCAGLTTLATVYPEQIEIIETPEDARDTEIARLTKIEERAKEWRDELTPGSYCELSEAGIYERLTCVLEGGKDG